MRPILAPTHQVAWRSVPFRQANTAMQVMHLPVKETAAIIHLLPCHLW